MRIRIFYELEINHHDGYCSGGECDYKKIRKSTVIDYTAKTVPRNLTNDQLFNFEDWERFLEYPDTVGGSGYCGNTEEADKAGLERHSHRYKILKVKRERSKVVVDDPEEVIVDTAPAWKLNIN
jgi:hypothetical protein